MRGLCSCPLFCLLLLLATPVICKKGGGGGSSDGDSGDGGSSDSGGSSGGTTKDEFCSGTTELHPTEIQKNDIYFWPGSFYNGTLTMTHKFSSSFSNPLALECGNSELSEKKYTYDAVLMVGPKTNSTDKNPVFWRLRAFQPRYRVLYTNNIQKREGLAREVVRLESAANETNRKRFTFDPKYVPLIQNLKTCWNTQINASAGASNTSNVTSWDLSSQYVQRADFLETVPNTPTFPESASNFITFQDVCTRDYLLDTNEPSDYTPYSPVSSGSDFESSLVAVFLDPSVGNMSASIRGVGSERVTFSLEGGRVEKALGGAEFDVELDNECDPYRAAYINLDLYRMKTGPIRYKAEYLNVTGEFGLEFEGTLDVNASSPFLNASESEGLRWGQKSGGTRLRMDSIGFLMAVSCVLFGYLGPWL